MAWCETVEYGKGPCVGCSGKANLEEMGSDDSGISSNDIDETNKKTNDGNDDDLSDASDDENVDSQNYFDKPKEQGILDECYDGPKSPLDAAGIMSSHKQSNAAFGWRSGGVPVKYKCSERGGLINKKGMSRFFLDRINEDGTTMVRNASIPSLILSDFFLKLQVEDLFGYTVFHGLCYYSKAWTCPARLVDCSGKVMQYVLVRIYLTMCEIPKIWMCVYDLDTKETKVIPGKHLPT